tara:strand:- start:573 stop:1253 length:681 start_codon:yes stop_codon:yes gene_type:complete
MSKLEILDAPSFAPNQNPKKLIFMLHGYGDNADNFIHIANSLYINELKINFFALNAPFEVPNYPMGRQWFDLYPNGIYIAEAGNKEKKIILSEINLAVKKIIESINFIKDKFGLKLSDCLVLGFSQGGMMTFELGHYSREKFGGLAILSGKILTEKKIQNKIFINTPLFISHGNKDDVLSVENFYKACEFLKENNFNYQQYLIEEDSHTISLKAIDLLQEFIKKNL